MNLGKLKTLSILPILYLLLSEFYITLAQNPDPLFELPVQLVGFPVIVLSVRLSQFAKKLAYSLNPKTYRSRSKRDATSLAYDADLAQKEISLQFGPKACILEEPCRLQASIHHKRYHRTSAAESFPISHLPWDELLSDFKVQSTDMKQWYLLSLFIGDAMRDVSFCKQLSKRIPCIHTRPLPSPQPR